MGNGFGDDVDHELTGLLDIAQRVLAVVGMVRSGSRRRCGEGRAEENRRRIGANSGEKAVRSQIADPCPIHRGNQRDGPGNDQAGHQFVGFLGLQLGGIDGEMLRRRRRCMRHDGRIHGPGRDVASVRRRGCDGGNIPENNCLGALAEDGKREIFTLITRNQAEW